jgi:hypothetical protein
VVEEKKEIYIYIKDVRTDVGHPIPKTFYTNGMFPFYVASGTSWGV